MAFEGGAILKRLMAGAMMLLAMVLFVPAGSAHAHGMGGAGHLTKHVEQMAADRSTLPGSSGCDENSLCCLFSQCSQIETVVPTQMSVPQTIRRIDTDYAPISTPINRSRRSGPATPPPKLDA